MLVVFTSIEEGIALGIEVERYRVWLGKIIDRYQCRDWVLIPDEKLIILWKEHFSSIITRIETKYQNVPIAVTYKEIIQKAFKELEAEILSYK